MALRIYLDTVSNKHVHAKPSETVAGVIVFYSDRGGRPSGRVQAMTVERFNERFKIVQAQAAA